MKIKLITTPHGGKLTNDAHQLNFARTDEQNYGEKNTCANNDTSPQTNLKTQRCLKGFALYYVSA